ncbi:MAG: aspartate:alanine exchanger family transporter [Planctomycetota bacterium]|jgi:putative transport protein
MQWLQDQPLLVVFAVIALGCMIGTGAVRGLIFGPQRRRFSPGTTIGVLLVALVCGHWGLRASDGLREWGFALFIYAVGMQSGPRFFTVMRSFGRSYLLLVLSVVAAAAGAALGVAWLFGFGDGAMVGSLAGSLTSTPTLAAATDAAQGIADSAARERAISELGATYAISYLIGMVVILALIQRLPAWLGWDLSDQSALTSTTQYADLEGPSQVEQMPATRAYRVVESAIVGRPLHDITELRDHAALVQRLVRGGDEMAVSADISLALDDVVVVQAPHLAHRPLQRLLGPEYFHDDFAPLPLMVDSIVVRNRQSTGRPLADLALLSRFGCRIDRIVRSQVEVEVSVHTRLEVGDSLRVIGCRANLDRMIAEIGDPERRLEETDLVMLGLGIVCGLLLGQIEVALGAVTVSLGNAGGLMLSGIIFGFLRSRYPVFGNMPPPARSLMMDFGLVLFMAGAGMSAGAGVVAVLLESGLKVVAASVILVCVPIAVGLVVGHRLLRLSPPLLMGALCGALTSTPALNAVIRQARSDVPALAYAGTYAISNVLMASLGALLMRL